MLTILGLPSSLSPSSATIFAPYSIFTSFCFCFLFVFVFAFGHAFTSLSLSPSLPVFLFMMKLSISTTTMMMMTIRNGSEIRALLSLPVSPRLPILRLPYSPTPPCPLLTPRSKCMKRSLLHNRSRLSSFS